MTDSAKTPERRSLPPLAPIALGLAIVAALLVLMAGPGTRSGFWHFRTGFTLLRYGAYLGIAGTLLALAALVAGSRRGLAVVAIVLALPAVAVPWGLRRNAMRFPPIHDITTDTQNPPTLVRLVELREQVEGVNQPVYEGDSIARLQREAYPDLQPVMVAASTDSAFALAFNTARAMGWEVAEADAADGRIEATATTRWFGFKDDVVIRVRSASGISRVDVRSISRVGRGDAGANAARIREFIRRLPGKVETQG